MMVLVCYDVATATEGGQRRLRRVAKVCSNYGQRVQNSVFECLLEPAEWVQLRARLIEEAHLKEDSLRFYFLGKNWRRRLEYHGVQRSFDPESPLIV